MKRKRISANAQMIKSIQLDSRQINIYNGLNSIGEEIATFYLDGIRILKSHTITSKSYLLAHIAREIEGGIRDIFASGMRGNIQKCPKCKQPIKHRGHIRSICFALGVDEHDNFAKEWHEVAREFYGYAHRHGPWQPPRSKEAFDSLWRRFEDILYHLVGTYYALQERLDSILKHKKPTKQILNTLPNLLKLEALRSYFFSKLDSKCWFEPLLKKGYFAPQNAPGPQPTDEEGYVRIPVWNVLPYLEKVSQQVNKPGNEKYIEELLNIIRDLTLYHIKNKKCLDNYHTWTYFVKILCNLPNEKIPIDVIELIPIWLDSKFDTSLQGSEILTKFLPKFLTDSPDDIKKAEIIVFYATDVKLIPKHTEKFKKEVREEHKELFEKPEDELTEEEKLKKKMFDLEGKKYVTKIDTHWLIEAFVNKKVSQEIGRRCSEEFIYKLAKNRLQKVLEYEYPECKADLSYIWMPSLSDYPSFINKAEEILTIILRDIVLARTHKDEEVGRKILGEFIDGKFKCPIFKRIALVVINKEWEKYNDLFWQAIDEYRDDLFDDAHYEVEIYNILEKHIKEFNEDNKKKIKEIIDPGPQRYLPEENTERYINLWKQKWYSALKADKEFAELYKKYRKETGVKEHVSAKEPAFCTSVGPGKSPLSIEQIHSMSNEELADFLSTFKTRDLWEGPTVGGLADALKEAVKTNPSKFVDNLSPFKHTAYLYIWRLLWGVVEAWNDKKFFDWGKLFAFLKEYISREEFWNDKLPVKGDTWKPNHTWVINVVSNLLQEGTRDDAWAFDQKYNEDAVELIKIILTDKHIEDIKAEDDKKKEYTSLDIHNTTLGNVLISLIYLSLRIARVREKERRKQKQRWHPDLKSIFNKILRKKIIDGYTTLGQYLPNIMYLDRKWTIEKIRKIERLRSRKLRRAFMTGYLNAMRLYDKIYLLEPMQSHYRWALSTTWDEHLRAKLVSHIAIGYLRGYDDLFNLLLKKWKPSQILDLINFFWQKSEDLLKNRDELITRILYFWCKVYEKYRKKRQLSDDDKKILSNVVKLTFYLENIDKRKFEWLMLSAPYVHVDYNERWFIEYLDNLKDKGEDKVTTIKYILNIIHEMLKNYVFPFAQDYMKSIIKYAYQLAQDKEDSGIKDLANQICNILGAAGYDYLRDIYEENNKQ